MIDLVFLSFFFRAEDGIRVGFVTGVPACVFPISHFGLAVLIVFFFFSSLLPSCPPHSFFPDFLLLDWKGVG